MISEAEAKEAVLAAVSTLHQKWSEKHVDETVQWAFNEFSDEAQKQIVNPVQEVIERYEQWQAFKNRTDKTT